MSISPELNSKIENDMSNLTKENLLRSGRSYTDFADEFSGLIAQAKEDREALESAGLDFTKMEEYSAILEKMATIYGERIASEGTVEEVVEQFRETLPQIKESKKVLSAVIRYILARTNDSKIKNMYDTVKKGYGNMDTIYDNIALVNIIRKNTGLASEVKPGGISVDAAYLDAVYNMAMELVELKGQADTASDNSSLFTERLSRIVSLAVSVEREIKLFAEMAFFDDMEKYDNDYASSTLRTRKRDRLKNSQEETEMQFN